MGKYTEQFKPTAITVYLEGSNGFGLASRF